MFRGTVVLGKMIKLLKGKIGIIFGKFIMKLISMLIISKIFKRLNI
tara:strand:+ start:56 stop:193 length:138 start_codon:yes stop_codon:yes gene_type:complete